MSIRHKFENKPPDAPAIAWPQGYSTTNSILKTPYDPEVIIIGSFNHGWTWNDADFFYGRGMYMWTMMANLFLHNSNTLISRRNPLPGNNAPTLTQIFEICNKGKLCYADVVLGTNAEVPVVINAAINSVMVNGTYEWSDYKDDHLNHMGTLGWLDNNVQNIIQFIQVTPSIKHIYFTFATGGAWIVGLKNVIIGAFPKHQAGSIISPTGNGFGPNLAGYPERPFSIAHHWVWNNMGHAAMPVTNENFTNLDHAWLIRNGVNPNNF